MNVLNAVKTIFSTERQASYASSTNGVPTVVIDGTNNGQGDGCMNFSTLASVLGELKREPAAKSTFQALPFGIVSIYDVSAYSDKPSGYSYSSALYIKQKLNTTNDVPIEVLIGTEDAAQIICTRYNYASDWNTLTVPSFYKEYSTLDGLILGVGGCIDVELNTFDYTTLTSYNVRTYYYQNSSPVGREGFLYVQALDFSAQRTNIQTFYSHDGTYIARRMWNWSANQWTSWVQI